MNYDNIRPSYFLMKWKYYEVERYNLSDVDTNEARIFFNALKTLDTHDIEILSAKYYQSEDVTKGSSGTDYHFKTVTDCEASLVFKASTEKYGHLRRVAEYHLKNAMVNILKRLNGELATFNLRINIRLYLVDFDQQTNNFIVGESRRAKTFNSPADDEITSQALKSGFEKVPV